MGERKNPFTIGGRVNEEQLTRVDAAATLARQPRAHFIVSATLERADDVLRRAAKELGGPPATDEAPADQEAA